MTKKKGVKKIRKHEKKQIKTQIEKENENNRSGISLNPVRFSALEALGFTTFQGFNKK